MSKVVVAVNAMIANKQKIGAVLPGQTGNSEEFFFRFDNKYNWSIIQRPGEPDVLLFFYPGNHDIRMLANMESDDWNSFSSYVMYSSKEIGTKEAVESFYELLTIVKEKIYGVDEALDEIISNNLPF